MFTLEFRHTFEMYSLSTTHLTIPYLIIHHILYNKWFLSKNFYKDSFQLFIKSKINIYWTCTVKKIRQIEY